MTDLEKLKQKIYRYFPRNMSAFSMEYDERPEFKNKLAFIRLKNQEFVREWSDLLKEIDQKIDVDNEIINETPAYQQSVCNYAIFHKKYDGGIVTWHLLFSFIEPVHVLLGSFYRNGNVFIQEILSEEIFDLCNAQEKIQLKLDVDFIDALFTNKLKSEPGHFETLNNAKLTDVSTQGRKPGTASFFDCMFVEDLATY